MKIAEPSERNSSRQAGLTLIELLISLGLGLVVMGILSSMLLGIYSAQGSIFGSSDLTSQGQTGAEVFRTTVRSSTGIKLQDVSGATGTGQLLISRTLNTDNPTSDTPGYRCVALFWLSGNPGKLYLSTASSGSALATTGNLIGWTVLVDGVLPAYGTSKLFSVVGNEYRLSFETKPPAGIGTRVETSVLRPKIREVKGDCY